LLTKTYIGLTAPQDRQRDMNTLTQVLRGKADTWSIEKHCVRKDGSVVCVCVNGAVLRDDAGRAVRIVAMVSDLTAGKQTERKLHDAGSAAKKDKPMGRKKKAAVKKAAGAKPSGKPRLKKR
jgi:hypothetical protein